MSGVGDQWESTNGSEKSSDIEQNLTFFPLLRRSNNTLQMVCLGHGLQRIRDHGRQRGIRGMGSRVTNRGRRGSRDHRQAARGGWGWALAFGELPTPQMGWEIGCPKRSVIQVRTRLNWCKIGAQPWRAQGVANETQNCG